MNILKTKQESGVSESNLRRVARNLSRCPKDTLREADTIKVWTCPEEETRMSELNTGQVWIPEVTHKMQGTQKIVRLQVQGLGSQCFNTSRASTDIVSMEISMWATNTKLQAQHVTRPTIDSGRSLVNQQFMDQFTQASEVEGKELKDFHTFKNEDVKLLSNI